MARSLVVNILSDASKFDKGINQAERSVKGFESSTKRADTTTAKFTGKLDAAATALKGIALAGAGAALLKFGTDSIKAASDLEESINAVEQTFESAADTVRAFGESAATSVGLSRAAFNELATPIGALLRNFGFDAQEAADATIDLTQRAADLASVFNVDVTQSLTAIQAALRGEGDPIERFGANVSAARVEAFALAEGLAATKGEIDDQIKVQARLGLILQDTARFAGDFADTADGAANQTRILRARITDLQAEIGQDLLGPAAAGLQLFGNSLTTVRSFVNGLTNLFNETEREAGEARIAIDELQLSIGNLGQNSLASFATLISQVTREYESVNDEGEEFRDNVENVTEELDISIESLREFAEASELTASDIDDLLSRSVEDLADILGLPEDQIRDLLPLLQQLRGEVSDTAAIDAYAERYERLAGFYRKTGQDGRDAASGNQELAQSFRDVLAARRELLSPLLAAARAQQRLQDAEENLADLRGDQEATAQDIARAELDLIEAQADAAIASEDFGDTFVESFGAALESSNLLNEDLLRILSTLGLLGAVDISDIFSAAGLGQSSLGAIAPRPEDDPRNFPRPDRQFVPGSSQTTLNVNVTASGAGADEIANATVRAIDEGLSRYRSGVVG